MADTVIESLVVRVGAEAAGLQKGYAEALKSTESAASNMTRLMSEASTQVAGRQVQAAASVARATDDTAARTASAGEQIRSNLLSFGNVAKDVAGNIQTAFSGGAFDLAKGVGGLASSMGMFSSAAQGVAAAVNTWVPALERATGALSSFMKAGAAVVEGQRKMAVATGLSLPAVAGLQHAANLAGFDLDTLSSGLSGLNRHLGQAINPSSEAARGLRALGLDARSVATMDADAALGAIGDALKKIENPAERAALAYGAFGRRAMELQPLAMRGSSFFKGAAEDADALGVAFSKIDTDRVKAMGEAGKRLKATLGAQLGGLQGTFASAFAPVATGVSTAVTGIVRGLTPVFQIVQNVFRVAGGIAETVMNIGGLVGRALAPAFNVVMDIVKTVGGVLEGLVGVVGDIADAVKTVLGPAFDVLGAIIAAPFKLIKSVFTAPQVGREAASSALGLRPEDDKALKDIKGRREQEDSIRRRQAAIANLPSALAGRNFGFGITGEKVAGVAQEQLPAQLQKQIDDLGKKREATLGAQVAEATGRIEDQVASLDAQGAAAGKSAAESARLAAVQALVKETGLSAAEAAGKLGASLDQLAAAATRNAVAQSVEKINDQTRAMQLQTQQAGASAAMGAKLAAVSELMKSAGVSTTEAWKQLGPAFERLDRATERQAVSGAVQKAQDQTRALEVQLATVGMTAEAAAKYAAIQELSKAANVSVAEATERYSRALDEQGRAQVALDSAKLSEQWKEQAATLGMTAEVAERYKLALRGATEEQLRAVTASAALKQAAENEKTIREVAEKLTEEMRTPMEVFNDRMEELNQLYDMGKISAETYGRAVEKAAAGVAHMNKEMGAVQGVAAGSAEALARYAAFQNDLFGGPFGRGGIKAIEGRISVAGAGPVARQELVPGGEGPRFQPGASGPAPVQPAGIGDVGLSSKTVVQLLTDIRDALTEKNKKPVVELRPAGIR